MNNLQKVSIGCCPFSMDVQAYETVDRYLKELGAFYKSRPEGKEILEGIEERMAELFLEKCGESGVVDVRVVEETLAILGKPDQIEEESEETAAEETGPVEEEKPVKKLYRDLDNKMMGGVLAGVSAYFKVDITAVRVLFLLLCVALIYIGKRSVDEVGLFLPIVYAVMWLCMPAARTVKEKLKLHGEKGTVGEIERNVEDGTAEYRVQQSNSSEFWRVLLRIFCVFIGIGLIVTSVSIMVAFGLVIIPGELLVSDFLGTWNGFVAEYPNILPLISPFFAKLDLALMFFIPLLGMIYGGLQLIFDFKSPKWHPGLVLFLLWIGTIMAFLIWVAVSVL